MKKLGLLIVSLILATIITAAYLSISVLIFYAIFGKDVNPCLDNPTMVGCVWKPSHPLIRQLINLSTVILFVISLVVLFTKLENRFIYKKK